MLTFLLPQPHVRFAFSLRSLSSLSLPLSPGRHYSFIPFCLPATLIWHRLSFLSGACVVFLLTVSIYACSTLSSFPLPFIFFKLSRSSSYPSLNRGSIAALHHPVVLPPSPLHSFFDCLEKGLLLLLTRHDCPLSFHIHKAMTFSTEGSHSFPLTLLIPPFLVSCLLPFVTIFAFLMPLDTNSDQ
jgi:hypothetical protein